MLDPEYFRGLGTVISAGPDTQLEDCQIRVEIPGSSGASIRVNLSSYEPYSDEETVTIAGETVAIVKHSGTGCDVKVPMRFRSSASSAEQTEVPDIVEVPPVPYLLLTALGFPASVGGNCGVIRETTIRILTMFAEDRVPLRSQSPAKLALADRSPCEILEHMPDNVPAERFDVTTEPYDCEWWSGKNIIHMTFLLTSPQGALRPYGEGQVVETIAGHPVLVETKTSLGEQSCLFRFPVGPTYEHGMPEKDHVVSAGQLSGVCEVTRAIIPTALELFGVDR
ncbi:hypothetical protein [Nocardia higoensis]|uniref:hypothetical protein n=1 Tax=Nocardia higoensis TaxID=228599 RepID=UPI0012F6FEE6|nr:hypothetical protein [Nocardia higoensis]